MCSRKAVGARGKANLRKENNSKMVPPDRYGMNTERIRPSLARSNGQESPESSFSATKGKERDQKTKITLRVVFKTLAADLNVISNYFFTSTAQLEFLITVSFTSKTQKLGKKK